LELIITGRNTNHTRRDLKAVLSLQHFIVSVSDWVFLSVCV